jgi:hypothetical protein
MPFRRSYRPRKFSRRPRRVIRRRPKVSKKIRTYVKKVIHRNIENKEIIDFWANQTIQTLSSGTNTGTSCRQLLPVPAQGTDDYHRIGNQIRIVKGILKGHINIKPYDATLNPVGTPLLVKMWLFRDLNVNGAQTIADGSHTTYFDNFFRANGSGLAFQGNPLDMDLQINDTNFRVLATKMCKIGASNATTTGPVGTGGYFDNSPMSVPFYFNWGKYCKKQLKFADNGPLPTNENIYIVVQAVRADGTSSGGYQMCEWHAVNHIKFEDA